MGLEFMELKVSSPTVYDETIADIGKSPTYGSGSLLRVPLYQLNNLCFLSGRTPAADDCRTLASELHELFGVVLQTGFE